MRSASGLVVMGLCAMATCAACADERPNVPFGPTTGGDGVSVVEADEDSGRTSGDDEDAGVVDAGTDASVPASSCEQIEGFRSIDSTDLKSATSTVTPADFVVTRQAIRWSADCENPILTVELSDGTCPTGYGHQLAISFSINDIEDGVITVGGNALLPEAESSRITARYTRPSRLVLPHGTWGTCAGVTGMLVFLEAPELTASASLQARYEFLLTPCDASTNAPIEVDGSFKLQLRFTLNEICPTRIH